MEYLIIGLVIATALLTLTVIILSNKLNKVKNKNNKLVEINSNLKEENTYKENELNRYKEQVSIYEKDELSRKIIFLGSKEINKSFLFKGRKVIIGDYMEGTSLNTMKVLQSFGITVDIVRSGKDIVDRIQHGYKYDLIFTNNVYKNGGSGFKTLMELKTIKGFNTPVIIHTVSVNQRDYFVKECHFDEYITKPVTQDDVKPILEKFLKQRRKKNERR